MFLSNFILNYEPMILSFNPKFFDLIHPKFLVNSFSLSLHVFVFYELFDGGDKSK